MTSSVSEQKNTGKKEHLRTSFVNCVPFAVGRTCDDAEIEHGMKMKGLAR